MSEVTWVQYVADEDQELPYDIERTMRLPFGGSTWLIAEEWLLDAGQPLPQPGDHPRDYRPGEDGLQSRRGDWVVERLETYGAAPGGTYRAIVLAICRYAPISQEKQVWREVPLAVGVTE
ncbi:MAG: hypothetical protein Fur0042_07100 [Cyanophyceae cyanobacterium]